MTATIISGKEIAQQIKNELQQKITKLTTSPSLAVILVGSNPASLTYVKNKEKSSLEVGIKSTTYHLSQDISQTELIEFIDLLNKDDSTNGILVQLPLPKHLNQDEILSTISPQKDVDGFTPLNIGLLQKNSPSALIPCTPKGIIKILKTLPIDLTGQNAVIVGRSQIVGLPVAQLLIQENLTVTITHSKTKDLKTITQNADILVTALGSPEFITKEHIKKGSIIIDVGINKTATGLKGDVKFDDALELCSYVTPVPGGVGPMTIAMLLENTYLAYLLQTNP
jgi:methylenetetrahydrofolate dehydrogenase (NADP+)/methenyltetrahydrofolate cyclohydrolase